MPPPVAFTDQRSLQITFEAQKKHSRVIVMLQKYEHNHCTRCLQKAFGATPRRNWGFDKTLHRYGTHAIKCHCPYNAKPPRIWYKWQCHGQFREVAIGARSIIIRLISRFVRFIMRFTSRYVTFKAKGKKHALTLLAIGEMHTTANARGKLFTGLREKQGR